VVLIDDHREAMSGPRRSTMLPRWLGPMAARFIRRSIPTPILRLLPQEGLGPLWCCTNGASCQHGCGLQPLGFHHGHNALYGRQDLSLLPVLKLAELLDEALLKQGWGLGEDLLRRGSRGDHYLTFVRVASNAADQAALLEANDDARNSGLAQMNGSGHLPDWAPVALTQSPQYCQLRSCESIIADKITGVQVDGPDDTAEGHQDLVRDAAGSACLPVASLIHGEIIV